jgi:uncharacterized protein (TIGR02284 family)
VAGAVKKEGPAFSEQPLLQQSPGKNGNVHDGGNQDANHSQERASIDTGKLSDMFGRVTEFQCIWQGNGIFAISPTCSRQGRIAVSRLTLPQMYWLPVAKIASGAFGASQSEFVHRISKNRNLVKRRVNMSSDSDKNAEFEKVVKEVINVLQDGQKGFADIGEHLKDDTLKRYFLAESLKRANFRAELENELHRHGVKDVHEEGTTAGTLHRTWGDLKAKVFGASDHELLVTAEQGEDSAKKVYKDALAQQLPLPLHQLLSEQNAHIMNSHDFVRNHRDALASK